MGLTDDNLLLNEADTLMRRPATLERVQGDLDAYVESVESFSRAVAAGAFAVFLLSVSVLCLLSVSVFCYLSVSVFCKLSVSVFCLLSFCFLFVFCLLSVSYFCLLSACFLLAFCLLSVCFLFAFTLAHYHLTPPYLPCPVDTLTYSARGEYASTETTLRKDAATQREEGRTRAKDYLAQARESVQAARDALAVVVQDLAL